MSATGELGHDAGILAYALETNPSRNRRAAEQGARRLRETRPHLDEPALEQLARVLRLPLSLVDPWLDDTLAKLDADDTSDAVVVERLDAIAWAWGAVPASWPPQLERKTRAGW